MDLDKILNEMKMDEVIDDGRYREEAQPKSMRMGSAVGKGFIESFVGSLPDKVGKDIKTRLGGSMGKRMTVGEFITVLGDIMKKGNMTQMVMLKDVNLSSAGTTSGKAAGMDDFFSEIDMTKAGGK